ncbi:unnamed protein product [Penicillium salamii]|uniref:Uncharacterized protein n=1 Tax=Penicillium salamii TaxID=1612424 RepID=A0A9W4J5J3_9EURO|nr:unnamed protein product [Penicillium salamii]CAG8072009.1 unnamed protein product [Penicillium salamii]CAG8171768.1 unnamed protein product [Penicillium salamii]CAG8229098.1 unnamed protein product [Penicillium salamii]CAG8308428.1 unnamed protein product [Penicillium salamii]
MYFHSTVALAIQAILFNVVIAKRQQSSCSIKSGGSNATDDAPAILEAFKQCGRNGRVIFEPTTYYVNSVMNISWLENVDIEIHGKLLVRTLNECTDIPYWLNNSLDVGYQNQSTALILGGNNVRVNGYGKGNFDGNGDYWYQWIRKQPNTSNYPGRPHAVTFDKLTNSAIKGLTFFRSQMWTMSIINSHHVLLDSILVNNTGNWAQSSNTDGADTIRSSHITFNNWTVYNGDDSISLKANSTDIAITNSKFYNGLGIAMGSIGQYKDEFETIERVVAENIQYNNTLHAFYVKTWTDDQNGYPPNGGGGGLGFASDMKLKNLTANGLRGAAFAISQCTRFSGAPGQGNCTNSEFQVKNVVIEGLSGTSKSTRVASLQCSAIAPCTNITILDTTLHLENGTLADGYLCGNVENSAGFECNGVPCVGGSATGEC